MIASRAIGLSSLTSLISESWTEALETLLREAYRVRLAGILSIDHRRGDIELPRGILSELDPKRNRHLEVVAEELLDKPRAVLDPAVYQ